MSTLTYNRRRGFSEEDDDRDCLSIEFTHPGMPIRELWNNPIITNNATSMQWGNTIYENHEVYNIILHMKMQDIIPFDKIDEIVEYLKKYNMTFHSILLSHINDDLDLTKLKNVPRLLSMRCCLFINLKCSGLKEIYMTENRSEKKLPPRNISLEHCKDLTTLHISGEYTICIDTLNKFKYLTKLETLLLNNSLYGNCNMSLPYLGNCPNLVKLSISSDNIPEMFEFQSTTRHSVHAKKVVKLCRNLKSDPHNRLVDICLALWNQRLPSYVILWIVNWLPHSDWFSTDIKTLYRLDKTYSDNANYRKKIPKWIMSNYRQIKLIRNINECKRGLIKINRT